ncbi:MAG: aminoglycoside phosphotransferase family protein [Bacteroidota bacterium]
MTLPQYLIQLGRESEQNATWVNSLPDQIQRIAEDWTLQLGVPYLENASCSYVVSCMTETGEEAVLKIGLPHFEALHEIEGLRLLQGHPTVRLLRFDKTANAMLLEKCSPGISLKSLPLAEQDVIICELLKEIWKAKAPVGAIRPLVEMVTLWNKETYQAIDRYPNPNLARQGCRLKEQLIESTTAAVLLATDLHAGNVLRAKRRPWLVIDIKPFIGDPAYDLTQHLLNSLESLQEDPVGRIAGLAKQANVSSSRLRDWLFTRLASEFGGRHQGLARALR